MQDLASKPRAIAVAIAFLSWCLGIVAFFEVPERVSEMLRFLLPGLVLACIAWQFAKPLPSGRDRAARIGASLLLIAAIAYAAQGMFAFDPADPQSPASRARVLAWTLSWLAFAPGAPLYAMAFGRKFVFCSILAAAILCIPALAEAFPAVGTRVGIAGVASAPAWFAWWFTAAWRNPLSRGAT